MVSKGPGGQCLRVGTVRSQEVRLAKAQLCGRQVAAIASGLARIRPDGLHELLEAIFEEGHGNEGGLGLLNPSLANWIKIDVSVLRCYPINKLVLECGPNEPRSGLSSSCAESSDGFVWDSPVASMHTSPWRTVQWWENHLCIAYAGWCILESKRRAPGSTLAEQPHHHTFTKTSHASPALGLIAPCSMPHLQSTNRLATTCPWWKDIQRPRSSYSKL